MPPRRFGALPPDASRLTPLTFSGLAQPSLPSLPNRPHPPLRTPAAPILPLPALEIPSNPLPSTFQYAKLRNPPMSYRTGRPKVRLCGAEPEPCGFRDRRYISIWWVRQRHTLHTGYLSQRCRWVHEGRGGKIEKVEVPALPPPAAVGTLKLLGVATLNRRGVCVLGACALCSGGLWVF